MRGIQNETNLTIFPLAVRHCSLGLEILEVLPDPDVVVVCCGGGGLLAGVAAAIKLSGCKDTRIYGVEPEGGKHLITALDINSF